MAEIRIGRVFIGVLKVWVNNPLPGGYQQVLRLAPHTFDMEKPISDFGAKIGGARKDLRGNVTRDDILRMTPEERLKLVKKDTVWPTPDYVSMVKESGFTPRAAAMVKMLRDSFPAGPQFSSNATEEQRKRGSELYAGILNAAKAVAEKGRTEADLATAYRDAPEAKEYLYEAAMGDPLIRGGRPELRIKPGKFLEETMEGAFLASYNTSSEIRTAVRCFAEGRLDSTSIRMLNRNPQWPAGTSRADVWLRNNTISSGEKGNGWAVTHHGRPVEPGSQSYSENKLKQLGFGDVIGRAFGSKEEVDAEILKVAEKQFAEKQLAVKAKREKFMERALGKAIASDSPLVERIGPDFREGANITGGDYLQTFGMRGGEYGLWVNQLERQDVTNKGYDSFCDITEAFGLPHKAASLGGTLAIAFGARGRGGWAAATYGPDRRVINLTKPSGEGCLAHEFGHALDHWLGTRAGELGLVERVKNVEHAAYLSNVRLKPESPNVPETGETKFLRDFHASMESIWVNQGPVTKEEVLADSLERRERGLVNLSTTLNNCSIYLRGDQNRIAQFKQSQTALRTLEDKELETINQAVDRVLQMPEFMSGSSRRDIVKYHEQAVRAVAATEEIKALPEDWTGPARTRPTRYQRQVGILDAERQKPYWSEPHEMFARTFESVVEDTLSQQNRSNYFLVSCTSGDAFPKDHERQNFRKRFTPLIQALGHHLPNLTARINLPEPAITHQLAASPPPPRPSLPEPGPAPKSGRQMDLF